jgi:hypothetical protein
MSPETAAPEFETRYALVCSDSAERLPTVKAALEKVGFTMLPMKAADDALQRMRRDTFEVVVVDEQFPGATPAEHPVLAGIHLLPMSQRRYMYVVLIGREFKTFDNMMALARSVNAVVNVNDLPHLPAILRKGITDHVEFYRTFRQALAEAGRR